ncbi:MAG: hypothetical protein OQJ99_10350 [Rhodospirillales bacterium]|nr:hypothetical protein [Rhodospirillales bacterium]
MFGILNPTKLLVTAAIVLAIWYGFKWIGRLQQDRKEAAKVGKRADSAASKKAAGPTTEDLIRCRVCGDYVPSERAVSCGRPDCPYPG